MLLRVRMSQTRATPSRPPVHEDIEGGMQGECVYAGEMAVVVADYFVGLQVPAFDHLVLAA